MHLFKLITTLKAIEGSQIKNLKNFINSPYFGVPAGAVTLFEYLAPLHPRFAPIKTSPDAIAQYSHTLSTTSKQSRAGSDLLEAVEQFITIENWQKNKRSVALNRLKAFKELQLTAQFDKGLQEEIEKLKADPEQDVETFFHRHLVTELSFNGFDAKLNRTLQNDIIPVVKTLDEFYGLKKLRYLCEVFSRHKVLGTKDYDVESINTLFKFLEPYTNEKHPYIYLFTNIYRMMEESTFEESQLYYFLVKQFVAKQNYVELPSSIAEISNYTINHCLQWYNKGFEDTGNEYLWWVEWKMKYNLLLKNDKLLPIVFRNIISIAVLSKRKPDWIDQIIKAYAPRLPEQHYETNLAFARGLYYYSLKKHKEAIRFLLIAQAKEEAVFNSIIRRWQWMSSYEHDPYDTDALANQLDSFDRYLQRTKEQTQHLSQAFYRFIGYAFRLLKTHKYEAEEVLSELKSEEYFPGSTWLSEQLAYKAGRERRIAIQPTVVSPLQKV